MIEYSPNFLRRILVLIKDERNNSVKIIYLIYFYLVSSYATGEQDPSSIDQVLKDLEPNLFNDFLRKWTTLRQEQPNTDTAVVFDGNWKMARSKFCFDCIDYPGVVLEPIPIGCTFTPCRESFYCEKHKSYQMTFDVDGKTKAMKPSDIKAKSLDKYLY